MKHKKQFQSNIAKMFIYVQINIQISYFKKRAIKAFSYFDLVNPLPAKISIFYGNFRIKPFKNPSQYMLLLVPDITGSGPTEYIGTVGIFGTYIALTGGGHIRPIHIRLSPLDLKMFRRTYRLPGRLPEGPSKIEWQIIAFATADIYFFHFFAKTCSFAHTLNVFSQI